MQEPIVMTITDFCRSMGIARRTFYSMVERGEAPPCIKIAGRRKIRRDLLEDWLNERAAA